MIANAEAAAEEMAAAAAAAMGEDPAGGGQEDGEKAKKFSGKALRHALGLSNFLGQEKDLQAPRAAEAHFAGRQMRDLPITCGVRSEVI